MKYQSFPEQYFSSAEASIGVTQSPEELDRALSKFRRPLASFIKELPQGAKVLDAGCGNGKALKMVRVYRPDITVYGMDISDVSRYLPEGVDFKIGSVEELGDLYEPETFDAVICLHVIEHLHSPMPMINSFKHVLKPGGKIFIETPNWTRLFIPFSHMFFWNDYTHVRPFSKFAMTKLFNEHDIDIEHLVTLSSHEWRNVLKIPSSFRKKVVSTGSVTKKRRSPYASMGVFFRVVAKILNPLCKDTLVVIGRKSK